MVGYYHLSKNGILKNTAPLIEYFKNMAEESEGAYQSLINLII
jgi:hypothetical protein